MAVGYEYTLERQEMGNAIAVPDEGDGSRYHNHESQEPPALPDGRKNPEVYDRRRYPVHALDTQEQAVLPRRKVFVADRRLIDGCPIHIAAIEFILVELRRGVADTGEIDLQTVLGRAELQRSDFRASGFGHGVVAAGNSQTHDGHRPSGVRSRV